jgi:hypothetical protein
MEVGRDSPLSPKSSFWPPAAGAALLPPDVFVSEVLLLLALLPLTAFLMKSIVVNLGWVFNLEK